MVERRSSPAPDRGAADSTASWRRFLARPLLSVVAVLATLLAVELATRVLDPHPDPFPPHLWQGEPAGAAEIRYVTDRALVYRPVLGTSSYSEFGTLVNDYPAAKREGVTRLLFLGDSVARGQKLQNALMAKCGNSAAEFWTAAVEGYNTVQEVEYYLRWAHRIRPDHVTLLFHNNDFLATPVAFQNEGGRLMIAIGRTSLSPWQLSLHRHSNLYRHWMRRRFETLARPDLVATASETREALIRLRDSLQQEGVAMTVVLLPVFKPMVEWSEDEKQHRLLARGIFDELDFRYFDLVEPLQSALAAGLEIQATPGDPWHPSPEVAGWFAAQLIERGYLAPVLGSGCRRASDATARGDRELRGQAPYFASQRELPVSGGQ